jgi:LacI family transcriptional regulator
LLRPASRPTAIFAANDLMAMGAIMAVRELGLHCPEDVSIVGFDNLDLVDLLQPPLTTVQQPVYRLGVTATELLIQRITGLKDAPREVLLETELIRRGSVMRLNHPVEGRKQKASGVRKHEGKTRETKRRIETKVRES